MVEVIYSSLDNNQASKDPDEIQCLWSMQWKFVWSPVIVCQHLVLLTWPDIKAPAVGTLAALLHQFKENLCPTHPCRPVSAGERLSQQFQLFKGSVSSSFSLPATI